MVFALLSVPSSAASAKVHEPAQADEHAQIHPTLFPPPPSPFGAHPLRDYGSLGLAFFLGSAATASGVGGGAMYVPLFDAVLGLGVKRATALSQVCIACGALAGVASLLARTHPAEPSRTLIDLPLAALMTPAVLLGVSTGVLANFLLADWLLNLLLFLLLLVVSLCTALKGCALRRIETAAKVQVTATGEAATMACPPALGLSSFSEKADWDDRATSEVCKVTLTRLASAGTLMRSVALRRGATVSAKAVFGADRPGSGVEAPNVTAATPPTPPTAGSGARPPLPPVPGRHPLLTRASVAPLLTLAALWAVLTGLQDWRVRVRQCSPAWFGAIGAQVGLAGLASAALVTWEVRRARTSGVCGGGSPAPPSSSTPHYTPARLAIASLASVGAGFLGGLLGIGGGLLIAPLLLTLRLPPPAAAATSTLLVLFSSSSAAVAAAGTPGALSGMYVAVFAPVAGLAGLVGVLTAAHFVKRSGRQSLLVLMLSAYVAAAAILLAVIVGPKAVSQLRSGEGGAPDVCA